MRCRRAADSSHAAHASNAAHASHAAPSMPPMPPMPRHPSFASHRPDRPMSSHATQARDGLDTVDANLALGLPDEARSYEVVPFILRDLGVASVRLLTNNPFKIDSLRALGVEVDGHEECRACEDELSDVCRFYLSTKARRMDHMLSTPHAAPQPTGQPAAPQPAGKQPDAAPSPQQTPPQQSWLRSIAVAVGLLS